MMGHLPRPLSLSPTGPVVVVGCGWLVGSRWVGWLVTSTMVIVVMLVVI